MKMENTERNMMIAAQSSSQPESLSADHEQKLVNGASKNDGTYNLPPEFHRQSSRSSNEAFAPYHCPLSATRCASAAYNEF
jgi:hypothetical protein